MPSSLSRQSDSSVGLIPYWGRGTEHPIHALSSYTKNEVDVKEREAAGRARQSCQSVQC